ncbi:MAG: alpha/beta fold hydrolase [Aureliella sp.]
MRIIPVLSTLALVLFSLPFDAPGHAASPSDGDIEIEKKSFRLPNGDEFEYELGTLHVKENRTSKDSRLINVGFARLPAYKQPAAAPPIFILPGGPGVSILTHFKMKDARRLEIFVGQYASYRKYSDVILVDQRGFSEQGEKLMATFKQPALGFDAPEKEVEAFVQFAKDTVAQYADTEVDLAGYTVKECAHDVAALAAALKYEKITLLGQSFGSQWGFAVMRLHPDIVARALLSGVEPLDHTHDMPSHLYAAAQRMWSHIDRNPQFQPYLPEGGMAEVAEVVLDRLANSPPTLTAKHPRSGSEVSIKLGLADFPYSDPAEILAMYHERWRLPETSGSRSQRKLIKPLIDSSLGVSPERRLRLWSDPATLFVGRKELSSHLATAEIWPSLDVGDEFRTPEQCDIPVVFAQGNWDLSTPIENTYEIAPFFPNSRTIVADRGGHGVINPIRRSQPDVWKKIEKFLRDGDMSEVPSWVQLPPSTRFSLPDFPAPDLVAKREKKLEGAWLKNASWILDYDEAKKEAAKTGKPIFGYFTASYSTSLPCIRLEEGAFSEENFAQWSKDYVMFCHITTKIESDKHQDLWSAIEGRGFPQIVFMNASGDVIIEHRGERTVADFGKSGKVADLKLRVDAGDTTAVNDHFLALLELGQMQYAEAKAGAETLDGLTDEQKKRIGSRLLDLEIMDTMNSMEEAGVEQKMAELGKVWYERGKVGIAPTGAVESQIFYWSIMMAGQMGGDAEALEFGLKGMEKLMGNMHPKQREQMKQMIKQAREQLKQLRKAYETDGGHCRPESRTSIQHRNT